MKRHEIPAYLNTKGIYLPTGTISNRRLDFLLLFKQLHKNKLKEIKALIERKGCMILHIDGTHKSGGRVVFVLQEGLNNIVLDADLIPSEAEEHVNPLPSEFKKTYGSPLVIVREKLKSSIVKHKLTSKLKALRNGDGGYRRSWTFSEPVCEGSSKTPKRIP